MTPRWDPRPGGWRVHDHDAAGLPVVVARRDAVPPGRPLRRAAPVAGGGPHGPDGDGRDRRRRRERRQLAATALAVASITARRGPPEPRGRSGGPREPR